MNLSQFLLRTSKVVILASGLLLYGCTKETCKFEPASSDQKPVSLTSQNIDDRYIVTLNPDAVSAECKKHKLEDSRMVIEQMTGDIVHQVGIDFNEDNHIYSQVISGFTILANEEQIQQLLNDTRVSNVEKDQVITLAVNQKPVSGGSTQVTPAGIQRVGGPANGAEKRAWILDTGIDPKHPDLDVSNRFSKAFITGSRPPAKPWDENGHGTHVAGVIGALNNNIGTVGVAAGCELVSIRVLNSNGSGLLSDFIAGLDYIYQKGKAGEVVNVSLGLPPSDAMDAAILKCATKGMFMALAAGNSAQDAINMSPARMNAQNVFTVSAMHNNDTWATFSNFGNSIDYCSPGVDVMSTWMNGGYAYMTGTSVAAPHLAGILLITGGQPSTSGYVINDPDGTPDPIGHL